MIKKDRTTQKAIKTKRGRKNLGVRERVLGRERQLSDFEQRARAKGWLRFSEDYSTTIEQVSVPFEFSKKKKVVISSEIIKTHYLSPP